VERQYGEDDLEKGWTRTQKRDGGQTRKEKKSKPLASEEKLYCRRGIN
jgi:hypothetical protein